MKKLQLLTMSAVLVAGAQANAEDYTYLFDPATMEVGQTLGEYLVVSKKCPKIDDITCQDSEKLKYVTAVPGRTGRLEIPVNAGNDFEISFNIYNRTGQGNDLAITLYLSDDSSVPLVFGSSHGSQWIAYPGGRQDLNWKRGVNDFRLISEQGTLKIGANDTFLGNVKLTLSSTITRVVISKIDDSDNEQDYLFEIRTRGIQKGGSTSCPTTPTTSTPPASDCTANYDPASGRVTIPCIAVPVTLPFGGAQTLNYSVEMQQQTGSFTFDLDLNKIVQK